MTSRLVSLCSRGAGMCLGTSTYHLGLVRAMRVRGRMIVRHFLLRPRRAVPRWSLTATHIMRVQMISRVRGRSVLSYQTMESV